MKVLTGCCLLLLVSFTADAFAAVRIHYHNLSMFLPMYIRHHSTEDYWSPLFSKEKYTATEYARYDRYFQVYRAVGSVELMNQVYNVNDTQTPCGPETEWFPESWRFDVSKDGVVIGSFCVGMKNLQADMNIDLIDKDEGHQLKFYSGVRIKNKNSHLEVGI